MKTVALQEVVEVNPRASKLLLANDAPVSFVPMAAVSELSREIEAAEERQYSEVSKGYTYFEEGDVIVAKITPCYENGKMALAANLPHQIAFGSTEFHVFRAGENAYNKYIFQLLQSPAVRAAGAAQMKGAAGQKRVSADYFKTLQIPLPPLAEQKRIAAILDAADALRAKRRESLAQLDTLLQSTFLDLFGDPVTNPKGWEMKPLENSVYVQGGFAFKSEDYCENGVRLVKISNVHSGNLTWEETDHVPSDYLQRYENFALNSGDLVIALTRPIIKSLNSVKVATVGPEDAPSLLNQRVARFVFSPRSTIVKSYLLAFCRTLFFKNVVRGFCSESLQPNMSTKQLGSILIAQPPLDLQRRFATIVESIEQQKARLREHLAELDTLFASLQHRAFNGEL
jgi:type I restriction enzyme S subunit